MLANFSTMDCLKSVICAGLVTFLPISLRADTPIDLSAYQETCEVRIEGWDGHLRIAWPMADGETGVVTLDLSANRPLIEQLAKLIRSSRLPVNGRSSATS